MYFLLFVLLVRFAIHTKITNRIDLKCTQTVTFSLFSRFSSKHCSYKNLDFWMIASFDHSVS